MALYKKSSFEVFGKSFIVVEVSGLEPEDEDFTPVVGACGFMAVALNFPAIPQELRSNYADVEAVVGQDFVGEVIVRCEDIACHLTDEEVSAIMAHEATHILYGDCHRTGLLTEQVGVAKVLRDPEIEYRADEGAMSVYGAAPLLSGLTKAIEISGVAFAMVHLGEDATREDVLSYVDRYKKAILTDELFAERVRRMELLM